MKEQRSNGPQHGSVDEIFQLLRDYKKLAAWAAGAVPFTVGLANAAPPAPGCLAATAIIQLLTVLGAYLWLRAASGRKKRIVMVLAAIMLIVTTTCYVGASSILIFKTPKAHERVVRGLQCNSKALQIYKEDCPLLDIDELSEGEFEPEMFWTLPSIALSWMILSGLWGGIYISLSAAIACILSIFRQRSPERGGASSPDPFKREDSLDKRRRPPARRHRPGDPHAAGDDRQG